MSVTWHVGGLKQSHMQRSGSEAACAQKKSIKCMGFGIYDDVLLIMLALTL